MIKIGKQPYKVFFFKLFAKYKICSTTFV